MVLSAERDFGNSQRWGTRKMELEEEIALEEARMEQMRRAVERQDADPQSDHPVSEVGFRQQIGNVFRRFSKSGSAPAAPERVSGEWTHGRARVAERESQPPVKAVTSWLVETAAPSAFEEMRRDEERRVQEAVEAVWEEREQLHAAAAAAPHQERAGRAVSPAPPKGDTSSPAPPKGDTSSPAPGISVSAFGEVEVAESSSASPIASERAPEPRPPSAAAPAQFAQELPLAAPTRENPTERHERWGSEVAPAQQHRAALQPKPPASASPPPAAAGAREAPHRAAGPRGAEAPAAPGALVSTSGAQLWRVVCDSKVRVRAGASRLARDIGTLEPGEHVEVVDARFHWGARWLRLRFWADFATFPAKRFSWHSEAWVCQELPGRALLARADEYPGGVPPPAGGGAGADGADGADGAERWVVAAHNGVKVHTAPAASAPATSSRAFREVLFVAAHAARGGAAGWLRLAPRGSGGAEEWVQVLGGDRLGGRTEQVVGLAEAVAVVEDWVVTWPGGVTVRAAPDFRAPRVGGIHAGSVVAVLGVRQGPGGVPWLLLSGWRAPGEEGGWREGSRGEAWIAAEGASGDTLLRRKQHAAVGSLVRERWKVVATRGVAVRTAPEDRLAAVARLACAEEVDVAEVRGAWARLRAAPCAEAARAAGGGERWARTVGPGEEMLMIRVGKRLSSRETRLVEAERERVGEGAREDGVVGGAAAEGAAGAWKVVEPRGAEMRDAPGAGGRPVGRLEAWRVVAAEEERDGWLRVADPSGGAGGAEGWWVWVRTSSMLRLGKVLG